MPETDGNKTIANGILGLMLLLSGFGGNVLLNPDEFSNAYVCPINENIGIFHRISATGKTGYYNDTLGVEKSISCRSGNVYASWISLSIYAESKGIDKNKFIVQTIMNPQPVSIIDNPEQDVGKKWVCGFDNCTRIQ